MQDELQTLRNDKIKLTAEVEVLRSQINRLEENERKIKNDAMRTYMHDD